MRLVVEPACFVWAGLEGGKGETVGAYPSQEFSDEVLRLDQFFKWNQHCRVPLTADLRVSIFRLFPYWAVELLGRTGSAQELMALIVRMVDRVCEEPILEFSDAQHHVECHLLERVGAYRDDDLWLAWCDLLSQCIRDSEKQNKILPALTCTVCSCVDYSRFAGRAPGPIRWHRGTSGEVPEGTVDPEAMQRMRARWKKPERPTVWEKSGHQAPIAMKQLVSKLVSDCEGVVVRFGSTYFNPCSPTSCSVVGRGTVGEGLSELECAVSDGEATVKGILRTTASTVVEQAAALSYVRICLRERCSAAGFRYE